MAGRNSLYFILLVYTLHRNIDQGYCQNFPDLQLCDMGYNQNNNVIVTDGTDGNRQYTREECACRIIRRVQAAIRIIKVETTCEPYDAWKFEIIVDGCLRHTFQCNDPVDSEYTITNTSTDRDIHMKLVKAYDDAEGLYYRFNVFSTAAEPSTASTDIIETQCGIEPSSIPEYDCSTFPSRTLSTTSISPSATTITVLSSTSDNGRASGQNSTKEEDQAFYDNPLYLGLIIGGGVFLIFLILICCCLCCRKSKPRGYKHDDESVYSYSRSLPGSTGSVSSVSKNMRDMDQQREKDERKRIKAEERERKRQEKIQMEENKKHIYDNHIDPMTYDNQAYMSGTQNSMPDFIPIPPPPPQSNGHVPNHHEPPQYSQVNKASKKAAAAKKKKKKSKSEKQEIAVMNGGSVPYGYYDKVVDSEFSFMDDETYSGYNQ